MNFLTKLLDSIVDFVKRMPLFAILLVVIAFVAPSLLGYMFYALLGLAAFAILAFAIFAWRLRRVQRDLHEQFRRAGGQSGHQHYSYRRKASNEGDLSVIMHITSFDITVRTRKIHIFHSAHRMTLRL